MQQQLDKFGRPFPPKKGLYYVPQVCTDAVVFKKNQQNEIEILLITRGKEPFTGRYAFPGGHLNYNEEPSECCLRELMEETHLKGKNCELLTVRGEPSRDPREHVVSIIYLVEVDSNDKPKADDDAATAQFYLLKDMLKKTEKDFSFDHYSVLQEAAQKIGFTS